MTPMCLMFMSDSSLPSLIQNMNVELGKVGTWFKANKLSLNLNKTNYILFVSSQKMAFFNDYEFSINIDSHVINRVSSAKFLGIYIDDQLSWTQHVEYISHKLAKNIGIISRLRHLLPKNVLLSIYYSLIHPYLSYCNLIWASTYCTRLNCLIILQKRIIRIICNVPFRTHTSCLFTSLKIMPFPCINKFEVGVFMFKVQSNLLPINFNQWFRRNLDVHNYETRSSSKYHQLSVNTTIRQHSIRIYGPIMWNSLPDTLTQIATLHQFKTKFKKYLLTNFQC